MTINERYYSPESNVELIPGIHDVSNATKMSDMPAASREWFVRPARTGYFWTCKNGKWPEEMPTELPSVEAVAEQKLQTINDMADAMLQPITSTYPNIEIISWDKQEIEARRWQEWQDGDNTDPEPPTSYIDNILLTRKDVDKPELILRIIYKADTFSQSGQVTGIRQTLEKDIEAILADDTLTDDQKREAINAIDTKAAFSVVTL